MTDGSFIGVVQRFVANITPYFLRGKNLGRFLESTALVYDDAGESLAQGLRLSQPLRCDESALPILSHDRGIRIYPTEPVDSKRYRLSRWWQLRRQFGTHRGEMRNLQPFFLPSVPLMRIVHQDGNGDRATWHTLFPDGTYELYKAEPSNWNFDGQTSKWSRWWCILYRDAAMTFDDAIDWDDGSVWDGGGRWDGGPNTDQIADIVAALREAKSGHSRLWGVIMTSDPDSFDPTATASTDPDGWTSLPTGQWGRPISDITGHPTRPPYASFLYDVSQGY